MPDMLEEFSPRPESKDDPRRPMGGKLRSDAWYLRDDGKYEHLLMFSLDYLEAFEVEPERWSDGGPPDVWEARGHPGHWSMPPRGATVIDRRDLGMSGGRVSHGGV